MDALEIPVNPRFQMVTVLNYVAKRVGFDLPPEAADKIVEDSEGNMRKAILVLEALKMQSYIFLLSHLFVMTKVYDQTRSNWPFVNR